MSDEIKISYDFLNEKLQQINEAEKALNLLVIEYGKQNKKFQDGDLVKLQRNGRNHIVRQANFAMDRFSGDFKLVVEYMIEPTAKNSSLWLRVRESEIVAC